MLGLFIVLSNVLLMRLGERSCGHCVVVNGVWMGFGSFMLVYYCCSLVFIVYGNYVDMKKTH